MKKNIKKLLIAIFAVTVLVSLVFTLSACQNGDKEPNHWVMDEDTVFYIDTNESTAFGFTGFNFEFLGENIELLSKDSHITLREDGTATLELVVGDKVVELLNPVLASGLLSGLDVMYYVDMVVDCFPGFDFDDIEMTFGLLEGALGLKVNGLNLSSPETKAAFQELKATRKIPKTLQIGDGLSIMVNAKYYIQEIESEATGEKYTAVYFGEYKENIESYLILNLTTDSQTGVKTVTLGNEMTNTLLKAST